MSEYIRRKQDNWKIIGPSIRTSRHQLQVRYQSVLESWDFKFFLAQCPYMLKEGRWWSSFLRELYLYMTHLSNNKLNRVIQLFREKKKMTPFISISQDHSTVGKKSPDISYLRRKHTQEVEIDTRPAKKGSGVYSHYILNLRPFLLPPQHCTFILLTNSSSVFVIL